MTEECDVLIVGGGPAGLAAAEAAAKLNARTVLLERQNEIGYPVHTSGGSWVSDMKALAIPEYLYAPNYPKDELVLIMGSRYAPRGYAWAFPRGNGRVRLGVGVLHPDCDDDARAYLDSIVHDLPQLSDKFKDASAIEYHTGLFPSEGPLDRFSHNGLLVAGDAGGHGWTLVGEGIRFAIY